MGLKRIYVEITNTCNLSCSFCAGSKRPARIMTAQEFKAVAQKIAPYGRSVYLHVKGEPLTHPDLSGIFSACRQEGLKAGVTTNGTLLRENEEILFGNADVVRRLNLSLQGLLTLPDWRIRLEDILPVCGGLNEKGVNVVFRLWTGQMGPTEEEALRRIALYFHKPADFWEAVPYKRNLSVKKGMFISRDEEFDWPCDCEEDLGERGFCYGTVSQLGILSDGTVVPCCLDGEGQAPLGNIFSDDMDGIVNGEPCASAREGFLRGRAVLPLCRRCTFRLRFSKKAERLVANGKKKTDI